MTYITPSTFADLATCAHRVGLDARGPLDERAQQDPLMRLLWEGRDTPASAGVPPLPAGAVEVGSGSDDARVAATLAAMRAGAPCVAGALLRADDLQAEVDLLERVELRSDLGDWSYLPVELRPGLDATTPEVLQSSVAVRTSVRLCLYADLLERAQGLRPEAALLRPEHGADRRVDLPEAWPAYEALVARVRRIWAGEEATEPGLISACKLCPWQERCVRELEARHDLTLISTLGPSQRRTLRQLGITDVAGLAATDAARIVAAHPSLEDRAPTWVRQAQVTLSGKPLRLAPWVAPAAELEISYDIEDDGEEFVYLHGFLLRERGSREARRVALVAAGGDGEADVWAQLLDFVRGLPASYAVYTYTDYEARHLRRMAQAYGGEAEVEGFLARTCDVFAALKHCAVLPTRNYTLKTVAQHLGFRWRDSDPGGAQSIAWWRAYRADPAAHPELRQRILDYNEDDCRATLVVRDWLGAGE